MKIIFDNNIFFSLLNPDSSASEILSRQRFKLIAPEFIKSELNKYRLECEAKSGLSKQEFEARQTKVESEVSFVKVELYKSFLKKALKLISDPDDAPYLALSMSLNKTPIWSNDPHFKEQSLVPVLTTKEVIELIS